MEPRGDQPQRSDSQSTPPQRAQGFNIPVQRRPPLSRSTAPQSMARQPVTPSEVPVAQQQPSETPTVPVVPEPLTAQPAQANESEPVIQMPQPESLTPPADTQSLSPELTNSAARETPQDNVATQQTQPPLNRDFTPPKPKKNLHRFLKPALAAAMMVILAGGIFSYAKVLAARNNPDTVMRDALSNSLSLTTVQSTTKFAGANITTQHDFTDTKNPVVNTASSVTSPKGKLTINGYGNLKNTFVNYASLPKTVTPKIAKQMSNTWVQLRIDGTLPKNTPDYAIKVSDPRYQAFGPIIMANFKGQTKEQLLDYMIKNKVYGYESEKTKKETLGEESVFVFPIKLDVDYLKVASQSAAVSMGLDPTDTQLAVDAMESLRGTSVTLYVRASDHTIARMYISKDGAAKTIDLSGYKETRLPASPQTKLNWVGFTPIQNQIEAQADLTKATY